MSNDVIHRGTLKIDKLKELCFKYLDIKSDSDKYSPELNKDVISLIKQPDGNWKGYMTKNGTLLETREQMPDHALIKLLTHD